MKPPADALTFSTAEGMRPPKSIGGQEAGHLPPVSLVAPPPFPNGVERWG
jgi:hypothetical protein